MVYRTIHSLCLIISHANRSLDHTIVLTFYDLMFHRHNHKVAEAAFPGQRPEEIGADSADEQKKKTKQLVGKRIQVLAVVVILSAAFVLVNLSGRKTEHENPSSSTAISLDTNRNSFSWFDVPRNKFAIVQFETRPPWENTWEDKPNTYRPTVHNTGSIWNYIYSKKHGHEYIQFHWGDNSALSCRSDKNQSLSVAWCKIQAMMQAQTLFPEAEYFLFYDTDAVVDIQFYSQPLNNLFHNMTTQWELDWNIDEKPFTFNMEGTSEWCRSLFLANHTNCINTGTVLWKRSDRSNLVLQKWWQSADGSYDKTNNPLGYEFRTKHPWEQVTAHYILQSSLKNYIQVVPQPNVIMQGMDDVHKGFCLSDCWLPGYSQLGCFLLHHCMMKGLLLKTYAVHVREHLEKHKFSSTEACYPRALLAPPSELYEGSFERDIDVAPCHSEWVGRDKIVENGIIITFLPGKH